MTTLTARRWRTQWALFTLVLAVAVIAGSVLAASLLLVRSAEQAGISGALTSMTADRVDVTVRVVNPASPLSATRTEIDDATEQAYGPGVDWASRAWATSDWAVTPDEVFFSLVELDDPDAAATLTEGSWPVSPPGVAVPAAAARSLGLTLGDSITSNGETPTVLRVDGIYEAEPRSGYFWENDPLAAAGDAVDFPEPDRGFFNPVHAIGPLIAAPGGIDASEFGAAQLEAVEHPTFTRLDLGGLTSLRDRAADAESPLTRAGSNQGSSVYVDSEIEGAVGDVEAGLGATRGMALVIALLLLVVAILAVAAVTRLIVQARSTELDLLNDRGASRRQRAIVIGMDAVMVGAVVALVSPWGGVLLHATISRLPALADAGIPAWIAPDGATWAGAASVAIVVAVLLGLPSSSTRSHSPSPRGALSVAGTTAIVVVAGLVTWRVTTTELSSSDPFLAAAPSVLLTAAAVLGSRAALLLTRPVAALAARGRGVVAPLAGWFASRSRGRAAGIALVALAVGASVVVIGVDATWQRSVRDEAAVAVGPPARIPAGEAGALQAELPPGAEPVIRRQVLVSKPVTPGLDEVVPGASAQLLGLDAAARSMLGSGLVGAAGGSAIVDEFPADGDGDTGPAVPEGSRTVEVRAALSAPDGVTADISMVVENDSGAIAVIPAGGVAAGGGPVTLTGEVDYRGITQLIGVLMLVQQTGESLPSVPIVLTLDSFATTTAEAAPATPLPLGEAAGWRGSVDDETIDAPVLTVADSSIDVTVTAPLGSTPITVGAVGWDPTAPIGAVLPETLADDLDVTSGAGFTAIVAATPVTFRLVGTTTGVPGAATADDLRALEAGIPSTSRSRSTIVVDGRALVHRLVQASAEGPFVDEFWATGIPAPQNAASAVITPSLLGDRMLQAPLRAEIPAAAALAVLAIVLLALTGFGARAASVSRSRQLEAAQLRALGLSRRDMIVISAVDTVATALAGIAVGLGGGVLTLLVMGTIVVPGTNPSGGGLVVPWQALVLLPGTLLAGLAAVSVGIAVGQRRLALPDLLRAGAEG
ncbi:FtsX-like permease family protein [Herbiconiux liukaitaii]|uniref:FtsX-like permease family protein n=1 Tax=Herbiconiux liukaitaii TaxID=3342799 RepID=UPI0035B71728